MKRTLLTALVLFLTFWLHSQEKEPAFTVDLSDGPYIQWIRQNKLNLHYLKYDASRNKVFTFTRKRRLKEENQYLKGAGKDSGRYFVSHSYFPQKATYDNVENIFVIGDIHGDFQRLSNILINSGVTDKNYSWTWGDGHLVFLGDIFDRGDEVTRILWLIKSLQHQAEETGGIVHLLLGNHETMILNGDIRYISDKYFFLTQGAGLDYSSLYSTEFDLGRWLRARGAVVKINGILFVHGGISPGWIDRQLSLEMVNDKIRSKLTSSPPLEADSLSRFLFGEDGPFWFRGYIPGFPGYTDFSKERLIEILGFYEAERIIYGHTPGKQFRIDFDGRLIGIDVSASKNPKTEQALMIRNGKYFKVYVDGSISEPF